LPRPALEGFGFNDDDRLGIRAAGAVLDYLRETQKTSLGHMDRLIPYRQGSALEIDEATRRSLELTRTIRTGSRDGSLLAVLDRTVTPMGSRQLGDWLANPLTDAEAITERLDAVEELMQDDTLRGQLRDHLRGVYDLERLLARVTTGRASPRDLSFIGRTLGSLPKLKAKLTARRSPLLSRMEADLDLCPDLRGKLEAALIADCPLSARDGGFIRGGFDQELDRLRDLAAGGKQWIAQYQARGRRAIGHPQSQGRLQQGLRLLHRSHQRPVGQGAGQLHSQADAEERRTVHHAGAEGIRRAGADGRREGARAGIRAVRGAARRGGRGRPALAGHGDGAGPLGCLASALAELARATATAGRTIVDEPVLEIVDGRHPVLDILEPAGRLSPTTRWPIRMAA
jgi:DNA mismatch repair protein MutS